MKKTGALLAVLIVLMSIDVFAITGIGQNTSLLLVSDMGHVGGNITSMNTTSDANSRKSWNRLQGDNLIAGTYTNTSNSGRFGLLNVDIFNPVIIGSVSTENVLVRQATVVYTTDEDSTTVVQYGTAENDLSLSSSSSTFVTSHSLTLFNLAQNTQYFFNVTSCDRFGFCRYAGTFTFRTLVETPSDTGGGGFGGGGVKKTTSGYSVTKNFAVIPADKVIQIPIVSQFIAFTKVMFKLKKTIEKVEIKITRFNPKVPNAPELKNAVYEYIKIDHDKITDADVDATTITFTVTKDWLTENKIDPSNIVLVRLVDNIWKEMPTVKLTDAGVSVSYESTFQGLSYYAIVGKEQKQEKVETVESETEEEKEEVTESGEEKKEVTPTEEKKEEAVTPPVVEKETQMWVGLIIFVVLAVIGYLIYRRMEQRE